MSKYDPLMQFLLSSGQDSISMTFTEIEQLLGFALPRSAYFYNAWWANGGHPQASTWLDVEYRAEQVNLKDQSVRFFKSSGFAKPSSQSQVGLRRKAAIAHIEPMHIDPTAKTFSVCGYEFRYLQKLMPECDSNGYIVKDYPQNKYDNKKNLPLSYHGQGTFCRFSINAGEWPGVYLWVVDNEIIYIGETMGLQRRFNMGYGRIAPRNCYTGGQSTNCKMNKVVLDMFEQGMTISLYFYYTTDYKGVELDLLGKIKTRYNAKSNYGELPVHLE